MLQVSFARAGSTLLQAQTFCLFVCCGRAGSLLHDRQEDDAHIDPAPSLGCKRGTDDILMTPH